MGSLNKWYRFHNYGMTLITPVYLLTHTELVFCGFALLSFSILWIRHWEQIRHMRPPGGIPNYITLLRFGTLVIFIVFAAFIPNEFLALLLFLLILLDGIDGYLARKLNQATAFGALFDMETDALFICLISCMLIRKGLLGPWILMAAFIKYYYSIVTDITGLSKKPDPKTRFGAAIAVIMFLSLTFALVLPQTPRIIITLTGTALIYISFFYSFYKIARS
jgi:phosphatidylglycerophosphate synthase